jgi:hypothetical protein
MPQHPEETEEEYLDRIRNRRKPPGWDGTDEEWEASKQLSDDMMSG